MDKKTLCLFFQVHQPLRIKKYHFFDIGKDHDYYDDFANRTIIQRIANSCYLPMNNLLLSMIERYEGEFRLSLSISGLAMEQFEMYAPEVLDSFRDLADTGCVEFLAQTYSHSLVSLVGEDEFAEQVKKHSAAVQRRFGVKPKSFNNTEMIYSDTIGGYVAKMGYHTMLTEAAKHVMGWKSPNYVYANAENPQMKVLMRNHYLSDDIAFRFSSQGWDGWPLTADKFLGWAKESTKDQELLNIFMDYETFGEHHKAESGIFDFMEALPRVFLDSKEFRFCTVAETSAEHQTKAVLHVLHAMSWADEERDLSAWLGNEMQVETYEVLYKMGCELEELKDEELNDDFSKLQSSDHFYYMGTKLFADGDVPKYLTSYESPYEAFINYMNVLSDMSERIEELKEAKKER